MRIAGTPLIAALLIGSGITAQADDRCRPRYCRKLRRSWPRSTASRHHAGATGAPPDNQVQQIELLGKAMLYDKELSVYRNEACAFCHMPETGFTGPSRSSIAPPAPIPARCARDTAIASRKRMPMRRWRRCCTTIPAKAISSAAISGTCARPAAGLAIRPPNRPKDRRPTRWKWACPISPARSIAPRSGPIARCSKACGARRPSRSRGRRRRTGLRHARPAAGQRSAAGSSQRARSRPRRRHFRSDGAIDCRLRGCPPR